MKRKEQPVRASTVMPVGYTKAKKIPSPRHAIKEDGWLRYRIGPWRYLKNSILWRLRGRYVLGCSYDGQFAIERHKGRKGQEELVWWNVGAKHSFGPELDTAHEYVFPYSCYQGPVAPMGEIFDALSRADEILAQLKDRRR